MPFGWYTATVISYVNQQVIDNYPTAAYFPDPEPEPGDGYCVDYPFDESQDTWICNESPIIINTAGHPSYQLETKTGVAFDLSGMGWTQRYSWPSNPDDAFLVYDADNDGQITSGKELFGNRTVSGAANGFQALALLSQANFGYIDATHGGALWAKLQLWHDRNHDGIAQADELEPASTVLDAIGLSYTLDKRRDGAGNQFRFRGWARLKDANPGHTKHEKALTAPSREFTIYDVILTAPRR